MALTENYVQVIFSFGIPRCVLIKLGRKSVPSTQLCSILLIKYYINFINKILQSCVDGTLFLPNFMYRWLAVTLVTDSLRILILNPYPANVENMVNS
jgi:hypothetical protein